MKKTFLFLFVLLVLNISVLANSDSTIDEEEDRKESRIYPINPNGRPNMPSKWYIECKYTRLHLSFIFPNDVEYIKATLGSEMLPVWVGFVNKSCPSVTIPEFTGEVEITCEDNLGRKYYGMLYFGQD